MKFKFIFIFFSLHSLSILSCLEPKKLNSVKNFKNAASLLTTHQLNNSEIEAINLYNDLYRDYQSFKEYERHKKENANNDFFILLSGITPTQIKQAFDEVDNFYKNSFLGLYYPADLDGGLRKIIFERHALNLKQAGGYLSLPVGSYIEVAEKINSYKKEAQEKRASSFGFFLGSPTTEQESEIFPRKIYPNQLAQQAEDKMRIMRENISKLKSFLIKVHEEIKEALSILKILFEGTKPISISTMELLLMVKHTSYDFDTPYHTTEPLCGIHKNLDSFFAYLAENPIIEISVFRKKIKALIKKISEINELELLDYFYRNPLSSESFWLLDPYKKILEALTNKLNLVLDSLNSIEADDLIDLSED